MLGFTVVADERDTTGYVALQRGDVRIGAVTRPDPASGVRVRRPPVGVELVLEVDDVTSERDRVLHAAWPLEDDLVLRPWGLVDFRVLDPSGYYLRITNRPG